MAVNHRDFNKIQKNYKINLDIYNVFLILRQSMKDCNKIDSYTLIEILLI